MGARPTEQTRQPSPANSPGEDQELKKKKITFNPLPKSPFATQLKQAHLLLGPWVLGNENSVVM